MELIINSADIIVILCISLRFYKLLYLQRKTLQGYWTIPINNESGGINPNKLAIIQLFEDNINKHQN
jgi:hypothetical protein